MAWRNFKSRSGDAADYLILGSGPSGLTCAASLAQAGHSVMVLEGHPDGTPGGTLHVFGQGGTDVCCGWHYGGCLSTINRAMWRKMTQIKMGDGTWDDGQRFTEDREGVFDTVSIPQSDAAGSLKHISITPGNFEKTLQIPRKAFDTINSSFNWLVLVKVLWWPLAWIAWVVFVVTGARAEAIMNFTEWCRKKTMCPQDKINDELEHIWNTNSGDHGMSKSTAPAIIGAAIWKHYKNGLCHFEGGMRETIRRLCTNIKDHGGAVLVHATVTDLTFDSASGRCTGMIVDGVQLTARKGVVISSTVALQALLKKAKRMPSDIERAVTRCGPSVAHGCLFLTYKDKTPKDLGLDSHDCGNYWIHADADTGKASFSKGLFLSGKQHGANTLVYILWESDKIARGPGYEEKKWDAAETAKKYVFKHFPKLAEATIDTEDASTPATTEKYLLTGPEGSSYGIAASHLRFGDYDTVRSLRPEIPSVPGLWYTGQDMFFLGVPAALFSGILTAQVILGPGIFDFFRADKNIVQKMLAEYNKNKKAKQAQSVEGKKEK